MTDNTEFFAHASAVIDAPSDIGCGTKIWHFTHVMPGARIGVECNIGQNVYIDRDVQVGDRCKIQNNVSVYKGVVLEDEVFCGPSMVFTNVINPRAFIKRKSQFKITRIGRGATLGANATIVCGVTIGAYALVGAGSVVTKDVPSYALIYGVPTRQMGWVCCCGITLPAVAVGGEVSCTDCSSQYRLPVEGRLEPSV